MKPLIHLTKKKVPAGRSEDYEQDFKTLNGVILDPDIMMYPDYSGELILDTDASLDTIAAALSNKDSRGKLIAYGSKMLNKQQRNYCITEKELLVLKFFTGYFEQYLLGRKFVAKTDHQALKWLYSLMEPKIK